MAFFDWVQFLRSNPNSRAKFSRKQNPGRLRPSLEVLEGRILFAVLPVALVNNPTTIATGFSPSMVQDPSNPQNFVEFHAGSNGVLVGNYSTDGGRTWKVSVNDPAVSPFPFPNIIDPNLAKSATQGNQPKFAMVTNVTAAWDRGENIYVTEIQRDATNNSGALVFERYSFSAGTGLTQVTTDKVLERWLGTDPILNPVVAVDNNLTSYTDTSVTPNTTQTDSMATLIADPKNAGTMISKAVYVAWNTSHTAPGIVPTNFTPNVIKVVASSDGGANFTTPQFVNDGGNIEAPILPDRPAVAKDAAPQIVFTQGSADGKVKGGQLVFVWNDFANNKVMVDASQPDSGVAATKVADSYTFAGATGVITDATTATSGPDNPGVTPLSAPVRITDTAFVVGDLEVTVAITHPHLNQLSLVLKSPSGTTITLLNNRTDGAGKDIGSPPQGIADQANLGVVNVDRNAGFNSVIGTVFDQNAPRSITDSTAAAPYTAHFRPESGSLAVFNGLMGGSADLTGNWTLTLTDTRADGNNPPAYQLVDGWSLHFTSKAGKLTTGLSTDQVLTKPAPITGAASASAPYQQASTGPYGPAGVGPGISVAVDNSLGAFGQFEGRLYIAYTGGGGIDTNVFLSSVDGLTSTGFGTTFNAAVKVNDDSIADNFSEGNRSQFMPTVAVDPVTGTVGVMYYDGRWDPAHARVANSFSASLDGGATFSTSTTLNTEKTAIDAITGKVVDLEPIPGNQGLADKTFGFGDRQSLVMYAGRAVPLFTSNDNVAGQAIKTAQVTFGGGPRILSGDMGAIVKPSFTPFTGIPYNNSFAPDGTRRFTGFVITFDRPIDWSTFTPDQVKIMYRDTVTTTDLAGVTIPIGDYTVAPLDAGGPFGLLGAARNAQLATTFFVQLKPGKERSAVGTYSYAIGNLTGAPKIRDHYETSTVTAGSSAGTLNALGNFMDQNQDAVTGETPGSRIVGTALQLVDTNGTFPPASTGTGTATAKYQVNDILTVLGGTFSSAATIRVTAVDNALGNFTGVPFAIYGAVLLSGGNYSAAPTGILSTSGGGGTGAKFTLTFVSGSAGDVFAVPTPVAAPGSVLSNAPFNLPYSSDTLPLIIPGPHLVGTGVTTNPNGTGSTDNLVLNGTNNGVDVTFDRNINPATFTAGNVLRITGPAGPITTYTLGPAVTFTGGGATTPATGVATIVNGFVTAVTIINPGAGYTSAPTVVFSTLTGGTGAFATAAISLATGKVTGVTITNGGLGYTSASPITVPAGGTLDVPMTITDSLQVNDLSVGISLAHGPASDLTASLVAPDGTTVVLFPGGTGSNLTNTVFDDNARESIANGNGPFTGIYRPEQGVTSAAIASGGSGYLPGDVLTVVGGTFATAAQLEVTSVSALTGILDPTAIMAGGTGYNVGDILTVTGGTFGTAATIKVTSVTAGVVDGAIVLTGGSYTAVPSNPAGVTDITTPAAKGATFNLNYGVAGVTLLKAGSYSVQPFNSVIVTDGTTGSTASGATFNLAYGGLNTLNGKNYSGTWTLHLTNSGTTTGTLTAWSLNPVTVTANPQVIASAAVVAGGSGYKVGDYITLQGGSFNVPAQLQVFSVGSGGAITGVSLFQPGMYSVVPTGTAAVSGGAGTGATFNLVSNAVGIANRTFHITFPTQSLSGTYSLQFGPDNKANYIADTALNTATVANPGSGYNVGDFVTTTGVAGSTPAEFMVTSVGAVTGPLLPASIASGGFGYKLGDILTVFAPDKVAATLQVTAVSGGVITGAIVTLGGAYPVAPVGAVTVTGGSGSGARFNLSFTALASLGLSQPGFFPTQPSTPVVLTDATTGASSGSVTLVFGNQIDTNLNAGVDLLRGGNPINGNLVPNVYPSPAASSNLTLPASQTVNSVISVPDSFLVEGVTLQLSIKHQNDPDLTAVLIAPDGTRVQLFSGVGTTGSSPHANFTNTTFDDTALTPIQLASTLPNTGIGAGPFNPQLPLSTFKNHGSAGNWTLQIHSNSSTLTGTLVNWKLTLQNSVAGSGLGEPVADQFAAAFRVFTQDPTNPVAQQSWTAVGPASINNGGAAGRIGGLALDPSDPSGNTVYVAGASGSIWKTTNFLTTSGNGPTYVPLTDLGLGNSLNTGSITVFGRNSDPNQSIVIVSTGEGDTGSSGVGFLRSMDGGRNWRLLDSTVNVVTAANQKPGEVIGSVLSINDSRRDHAFAGTTSYKVIVDPTAQPNGQVIVYAALSSGIWRSTDTGGTWTRLQAGVATDVVLSAGSAGANGNLQILYGAIQGTGVYYSTNAPTAASMSKRAGGAGVPLRRNIDNSPDTAIPVSNAAIAPLGSNGRIVLAVPALTGNALQDTLQEGWLYAAVSTTTGVFKGLYSTKDFGLNWTQIFLPVVQSTKGTALTQVSTNDDKQPDYSVDGGAKFPQANYNVSLAVDPNNPNVVYFGGTADANPVLNGQGGGFIRVDATALQDVYNEVAYDNSNNDGGLAQTATSGGVLVSKGSYGITTSQPGAPYLNLLRDPNSPFLTPSSLQFTGITSFTNSGGDATYGPFDGGGLGGTDQHRLVVFKDPLTGHTRLIFGDDQGVWTGTDNGRGSATGSIGGSTSVVGSRNGNLQITQFYDGATQPSTLAADIAGALFYSVAQDDGFPVSDSHVLDNGQISWTGGGGDGSGVKVDQTGSGTAYYYKWPCCGAGPLPSDFFTVIDPNTGEISRTTGLLQTGDDPYNNKGQWGFLGGSKFAVNPIDPTAIVMSSSAGRIFLTSGPSLGYGKQWFPIGDPGDLDNTYAPAVAFGAPADANAPLSNFIYAGTSGGKIFMTLTGGGVGVPWTNISAGLDGSGVQFIVTNPIRGSHEAYAVTSGGVFWMADSTAAGATWVNITGNLFGAALSRTLFNDPAQALATLTGLNSLQADWRYAIPDNLANPAGPTHPVLYAAGTGGVYRSLDKGVTWTYYPDTTIDGARQAGGFLPSVQVTNLALSLGNINPVDGTPSQPFGRNMLVATTYGRGVFAIRLDDQIRVPGGNPLYTYAVSAVAGPHVVSLAPISFGTSLEGIRVNFSGPVDPATFTTLKVNGVTDPLGNPVAVQSIIDENATNHNVYDIIFSSLDPTFGFYHLSMGPNISDYSGNKMDQNQNFINGENPADAYSGRFLYQPFTNNAPVLGVPAGTISSVNEDQTAAVINGMSVNAFVAGLPAPGITDADNSSTPGYTTPAAPVGIAITGIDNTNGLWQYSLDGTIWMNIPAVSDTSALLLEADTQPNATGQPAADRVRFLPKPNWSGTATFTFRAWDLTSGLTVYGADGTTADASVNSAGNAPTSAYSASKATATITVNFVNDQPSFTAGSLPAVNEDSGANSVTNFVTSFNPGGAPDANELGQTPTYLVSNITNPGLFAVAPAIDASGKLTYTLNPNVSGSTKFDVAVMDNGGTAFGGIDTSPTQTFTLNVNFVNDKPSFVASNPPTVLEDTTTPQTVTGWATFEPSGGPVPDANEASQTVLAYTVSGVSNPALFAAGPTVDNSGNLHYTLNPNVSGSSTFTVKVRDNGGTAFGGIDTSDPQTFTLAVTFVNDQPSFVASNPPAVNEDTTTQQTVTGWAKFEPSGGPVTDANEIGQTATYLVSNVTPGVFAVAPAIDPSGNLTYTLNPNVSGAANFSVAVMDNGGIANGGIDTSAPKPFTLTVNFVNDKPSFVASNPTAVLEDTTTPQTVTGWATFEPSGGPVPDANEASQTVLAYTVSGVSNPALFAAGPTVDNSGNLHYTLNPNVSGSSTFTVKVRDNGGTAFGGIDTSAPQTFTLNVNFVNDQPSFTAINPPMVIENTGAHTVSGFVTSFNPGGAPDANEAGQSVLGYTVSAVSNPSLFSVGPAVDNSGTLTYTLAPNAFGTSTFQLVVQDNGGTANGGIDTSAPQTFTITARQTDTVSVISSQPTSTVGQSVTFSATVAPTAGGIGNPTGTVTFTGPGNQFLGSASLMTVAGKQVASISTSALPVGANQTITASYGGDGAFAPNTGTVSQTVKPLVVSSTGQVKSSLNPSLVGQAVTFSVAVTSGAGTVTSGTVTFYDGATAIGTGTTTGNGTWTFMTSALGVGTHNITAKYGGNAAFAASDDTTATPLAQIVKIATTTTLTTSNPNPPVNDQSTVFTASVSFPMQGTPPSGYVAFYSTYTANGHTYKGFIGYGVSHNDGTWTFNPTTDGINGPNPGFWSTLGDVYTISAHYYGDANYNLSDSNTIAETVGGKAATSTNLTTSNQYPPLNDQSTVFTATVSGTGQGGTPPGGYVAFYSTYFANGQYYKGFIGYGNYQGNGVWTFNPTTDGINGPNPGFWSPAGAIYTISAHYYGDANYALSDSNSIAENVGGNGRG